MLLRGCSPSLAEWMLVQCIQYCSLRPHSNFFSSVNTGVFWATLKDHLLFVNLVNCLLDSRAKPPTFFSKCLRQILTAIHYLASFLKKRQFDTFVASDLPTRISSLNQQLKLISPLTLNLRKKTRKTKHSLRH